MDFETLVILLAMLFGYAAWRLAPRFIARVPFVEPEEVVRWLRQGEVGVVVDVRSHGDYIGKGGHIQGAINLPYGYIAERLEKVGRDMEPYKNQPILVTAGADNLAAHSARLLRKAGFTNLAILRGGMKKWNSRGLPVEHGLPEDAEIRME